VLRGKARWPTGRSKLDNRGISEQLQKAVEGKHSTRGSKKARFGEKVEVGVVNNRFEESNEARVWSIEVDGVAHWIEEQKNKTSDILAYLFIFMQ
jgi:hypothetical protein